MGITMTTPQAEIDAYIERQVQAMRSKLIRYLQAIGETVVTTARNLPSPNPAQFKSKIPPHTPNYIDWTANLRSSIGYIIVDNGSVVQYGGFAGKGREGESEGRRYAESLASKYPNGIVLIVVAGMRYAAYVQNKGYDVLASAEIEAEKLMNNLRQQMTK